MHKDVFLRIIILDESKPLGLVEEFYCTLWHKTRRLIKVMCVDKNSTNIPIAIRLSAFINLVFLRIHARVISWLLFLFLCQACHSPKKFDRFDAPGWRSDPLGCKGNRQRLAVEFEKIRRELRGLSQTEIMELLGKPDIQGLSTRHQKFFVYYLVTGPQCQNPPAESTARTVAVRFGALGYVTEVSYQQGRP